MRKHKDQRKIPRRMKWIYSLIELKQGQKHVKCPHCGEESLDYGFMISDKISKVGFGAIWCYNCHHGYHICRADLKKENKTVDDFPKEIIYV